MFIGNFFQWSSSGSAAGIMLSSAGTMLSEYQSKSCCDMPSPPSTSIRFSQLVYWKILEIICAPQRFSAASVYRPSSRNGPDCASCICAIVSPPGACFFLDSPWMSTEPERRLMLSTRNRIHISTCGGSAGEVISRKSVIGLAIGLRIIFCPGLPGWNASQTASGIAPRLVRKVPFSALTTHSSTPAPIRLKDLANGMRSLYFEIPPGLHTHGFN